MKIKNLLIPLLSFIICMFAFTACSKYANFIFDENSTVKLTYTCVDEEHNFDDELNSEQSHDLIISLNKISYRKINNKDIDFAPSYDSLTIKINDETLFLSDIFYIINYGGYFNFNGELCNTKEKFSFLESYLVDYSPDIIPNSVPFGVQYVKSSKEAGENYQIIKRVSQLNKYIASTDLPDIVLFKDELIKKYNNEYFENSFLVIFTKEASSGSFNFAINNVYVSYDQMIIDYEVIRPSDPTVGVTDDMAYWYSFVELSNEYDSIKNVYFISSK